MKYQRKKEREFLELLEREDRGEGVEFSDHQFIKINGFPEKYLGNMNETAEVSFYFSLLVHAGYLSRDSATDTSATYSLTLRGHERLITLRDDDFGPKGVRFLRTAFGTLFMAIVVPILVTLLTLLTVDYLGWEKSVPGSGELKGTTGS